MAGQEAPALTVGSTDRVFLLPPPSASRLTLAQLTLGAAAIFASSWFLIFRPGSSSVVAAACVEGAVSSPTPTAQYLACTSAAFVREALVVLAGPAVLALLAVLGWFLAPYGLTRWWSVRPIPDGSVRTALNEFARELGTEELPQWCSAPGSDAWTYGRWPHYRVVLGHNLVRQIRMRGIEPARAVVAHELAHLRNRDVDRTYITLCALVLFAMLIAVPLAADAVVQGLGPGLSLAWRLIVIVAVVLFTGTAVLRSREHDADLRAASSCPDVMVRALMMSAARSSQARFRRPRALRLHPVAAERLAVIEDPSRVMRVSAVECLAAGVAAGVVLVELPGVVLGLLSEGPGGPVTAYLIAGWLVGIFLTRVVGLSAWRAALDAANSWGGRTPRVFVPGMALGIGFLIGSQVSPRASASWQAVFGSASDREFTPALQSMEPSSVAWLLALALMTGVLFVAWSTAMGAGFVTAHRRVVSRSVVLLVETTVLAVPLGGWFLALRLASSGGGVGAPALAAVLVGRHAVLALVATVLFAMVCLVLSPSRPPWRRILLAAIGSVVFILAVAAPAAIGPSPAQALPGVAPLAASVPFPSSRTAGTACLWLHTIGSIGAADDSDYQRRLGGYLARTDDPLMRDIGTELISFSNDPGGDTSRAARTALVRRCDELRTFGH